MLLQNTATKYCYKIPLQSLRFGAEQQPEQRGRKAEEGGRAERGVHIGGSLNALYVPPEISYLKVQSIILYCNYNTLSWWSVWSFAAQTLEEMVTRNIIP